MKFAKVLKAEMVHEWEDMFINYKLLKKLLNSVRAGATAMSDICGDDASDDSEDEDRGGGQDVDEDVEDGTHETHPRKGREDGDDVAPAERDSDSERLFAHSSSAGRIQVEEIASSSDPSAVVLGDGRRVAVCALTLRTRVAAASYAFHEGMIAAEESFFVALDGDVAKADEFFVAQLDALCARLATVRAAVTLLQRPPAREPDDAASAAAAPPAAITKSRVRAELIELHASLGLLLNFATLNHMAARKILKKHDKVLRLALPRAREPSAPLFGIVAQSPLRADDAADVGGDGCTDVYLRACSRCAFMRFAPLLETLRADVCNIFAACFTKGDASRAGAVMHTREGGGHDADGSWDNAFGTGLHAGVALAAFALPLARTATLREGARAIGSSLASTPAMTLARYRIVFLFALHALGFACDLRVWRSAHVNFRFIFQVSRARITRGLSWRAITRVASAAIALVLVHAAARALERERPGGRPASAISLAVLATFVLASPRAVFVTAVGEGGRLARVVMSVLVAPFVPVDIAGFFVADQLCSHAVTLGDVAVSLHAVLAPAFGGAGPAAPAGELRIRATLALLPYWCRFWQCVRRARDERRAAHMVNAGKYFFAMSAVIAVHAEVAVDLSDGHRVFTFASRRAARLALVAAAATYAYAWDIVQDFGLAHGLLQRLRGWAVGGRRAAAPIAGPLFLRSRLNYPPKMYYAVVAADGALHFAWLVPAFVRPLPHSRAAVEGAALAFGALGVLRRVLWNMLRLENEHATNCGRFRATRHVILDVPSASAEDDEAADGGASCCGLVEGCSGTFPTPRGRVMLQQLNRAAAMRTPPSPPSQSGVQLNQISPNINQPCPNPERTSSADLNVDANVSLPPGSPKLRKRDRQAG